MAVATSVTVDLDEPSPTKPGLVSEPDEPEPELDEPEPEEPDEPEADEPEPDEPEPDEPVPDEPDPLPPFDDPALPVSAGEEAPVDVDPALAIGHTVVEIAIISVVTEPTLPGQSVTVAAHDVMVYVVVLKIVLVVHACSEEEEPLPPAVAVWASADDVEVAGCVTVTGKLVVWVRAGQSVMVAAQEVTV